MQLRYSSRIDPEGLFLLRRLHSMAFIGVFAAVAALATIALKAPFQITFICLCVATAAAFAVLIMHQAHRARLEQLGNVVGQFMRGAWQTRTQPSASDDEFSRLQHRINNLLDVVDLHIRGDDAAIDLQKHAEYAEKLRLTPLGEMLADPTTPAADVKEAAGSFLEQLGQHMSEMLAGEEEKISTAPASVAPAAVPAAWKKNHQHLVRQLEVAAARLASSSTQLAQRAMQSPAADAIQPSPEMMEQALARMQEQATVLSLNIAIEAGRAPSGSSLHHAAEELRSLVTQLQKARGHAATLKLEQRGIARVPSDHVPLSYAAEALALAEQSLREQAAAAQQLAQLLEPEQPPDERMDEAA